MKNRVVAGVAALFMVACASMTPQQQREWLTKELGKQGTVLKHYDRAETNDEIFIMKDPAGKIWKIRMFPFAVGDGKVTNQVKGYQYEAMYTYDQNIGLCSTGPRQTPIPCDNLKKDADLGEYIK